MWPSGALPGRCGESLSWRGRYGYQLSGPAEAGTKPPAERVSRAHRRPSGVPLVELIRVTDGGLGSTPAVTTPQRARVAAISGEMAAPPRRRHTQASRARRLSVPATGSPRSRADVHKPRLHLEVAPHVPALKDGRVEGRPGRRLLPIELEPSCVAGTLRPPRRTVRVHPPPRRSTTSGVAGCSYPARCPRGAPACGGDLRRLRRRGARVRQRRPAATQFIRSRSNRSRSSRR